MVFVTTILESSRDHEIYPNQSTHTIYVGPSGFWELPSINTQRIEQTEGIFPPSLLVLLHSVFPWNVCNASFLQSFLAHSNGGQWQRCPDRVQKPGGSPYWSRRMGRTATKEEKEKGGWLSRAGRMFEKILKRFFVRKKSKGGDLLIYIHLRIYVMFKARYWGLSFVLAKRQVDLLVYVSLQLHWQMRFF